MKKTDIAAKKKAFKKLKAEKFTTFCSDRVYNILIDQLGAHVQFVELRIGKFKWTGISLNGLYIVREFEK